MLLFYLIIFMNLVKSLRTGSGAHVDGWAHHLLRADSASLSPAGHVTDRASPRSRSAATIIGRVNECRLAVHLSVTAVSAWESPSVARGASLTPEAGPLEESWVHDQREHSLTNPSDAVAVGNAPI
jgi:hypothetical protein